MSIKFQTIVVDCPWAADDNLNMSDVKRGASSHYSLLDTKALCKMPVGELADPSGCVLALWVLGSMLQDGMDVMKSWGFEQKQTFVWVKTKKKAKEISDCLSFGMGRTFRQSHELCLIGINTTKFYQMLKNKSQRSVCFEENQGHSIKPEILQDRLDLMVPEGNKCEIFARRQRQNWICIGNEAPDTLNEDILLSIDRLLKANTIKQYSKMLRARKIENDK